jgi:hypothetical protein
MSAWTCRSSDGKADRKIVPPYSRIPSWKGPSADSEEKHEPAGDTDTSAVDSLKALDPNRPIREADIRSPVFHVGYGPSKRHRVMKKKDRPVTVSQKFNLVFCQAAKVAAFFRFLRQLSGPNAPRPVAKRGSVAGRGWRYAHVV